MGEEDKADTKKMWEDNIREWTGLEFAKSKRAVENRNMEETNCVVTCGVSTTPAVNGQVQKGERKYSLLKACSVQHAQEKIETT